MKVYVAIILRDEGLGPKVVDKDMSLTSAGEALEKLRTKWIDSYAAGPEDEEGFANGVDMWEIISKGDDEYSIIQVEFE